MPLREIEATRVAVCGAGYTGQAIARVLRRMGKQVVVTDSRELDQLGGAERVLADIEVELHAGGHDPAVVCSGDLVVISPGVPYHTTPALIAAREQGLPVWGEVEFAARLTDARIIGITGTKGKTTTATLVSRMLDVPLANAEAYAAKGVPLIELVVDNPDLDLVVAELSSYQLESSDQLKPFVAALLNLGEDHTERHPTRAEYLAAKSLIFKNQGPKDRSVYNFDDPELKALGEGLPTIKAAFSTRAEPPAGAWSTAEGISVRLPRDLGGDRGRLIAWSEVAASMQLQKPSLLAAVSIALMAGAGVLTVREMARKFEGLPHRMEFVRTWKKLTFINDSKATNPLATENAIRQSPRPVVLLAGGDTKGIDLSPLKEPFMMLRGLVLYGADADKLEAIAQDAHVNRLKRADSLEDAVEKAIVMAEQDDWIVLSPCAASFDMFAHFAERGDRFKEIVNAL